MAAGPPCRADAGQSTLASSWAGLVESKPIGSPDADRLRVVFVGSPAFEGDEALLFDSARDRGGLPEEVTLARLVVRFPEGSPDLRGLDPGLELRVFVDDPTTPRARVRLADLVRRRGERPLNLRVGPGQAVRIVLADPAGAWARGAPRIEVALGW